MKYNHNKSTKIPRRFALLFTVGNGNIFNVSSRKTYSAMNKTMIIGIPIFLFYLIFEKYYQFYSKYLEDFCGSEELNFFLRS